MPVLVGPEISVMPVEDVVDGGVDELVDGGMQQDEMDRLSRVKLIARARVVVVVTWGE